MLMKDLNTEEVESQQDNYRTPFFGSPPSLYSISSSKIDAGLIRYFFVSHVSRLLKNASKPTFRDNPSSADAISKIYVCATMWHESGIEQFNLVGYI